MVDVDEIYRRAQECSDRLSPDELAELRALMTDTPDEVVIMCAAELSMMAKSFDNTGKPRRINRSALRSDMRLADLRAKSERRDELMYRAAGFEIVD